MNERTCSVAGCDRKYSAKGLCKIHYGRLAYSGNTEGALATRTPRSETPCSVDGCDRFVLAKGLCDLHYGRQWRLGSVDLPSRSRPVCSVHDCLREAAALGLCGMHYQRQSLHGSTDRPLRRKSIGCLIDGCQGGHVSHGWCAKHYGAWSRHGDPLWTRSTHKVRNSDLACSIEGCDRNRKKVDLCGIHARRKDKGADLHAPIRGEFIECSADECTAGVSAKGMCKSHYRQWYKQKNAAELEAKQLARMAALDPATVSAKRRAHYEANRERIREAAKRRYQEIYPNDPTKWRAAKSRRMMRLGVKMSKEDRHISEEYRRAIATNPCFYCGSAAATHVDHFFPLAKGGTDHWHNLVRACPWCNNSKNAHCGTWFILKGRSPGVHTRRAASVVQADQEHRRVS